MNSEAAVLNAVSVQGALRVIQLVLQLFAFLFPKQAYIEDNFSYDFIIAGAGTAGCLLARRLSDNENVNVLLIEDGDNPSLEVMLPGLTPYTVRTKFDWNYTSVNDNYSFQCYKSDVYETTGRGLGGGSSINYMMYARGDPNDYRQWAEKAKNPTWNFDNILPYFKKGERLEEKSILKSKYRKFHGTNGELRLIKYPDTGKLKYLKALNEIGHKIVLDTNGRDTLGFNFPLYNIAEGIRHSSCYCYVSPVKDRKNLHVLKNTKVTKVIFKKKKAIGVEIMTSSNQKMFLRAKLEVILSAGAFNTPQLLMLSGIGPKEHLKSFNIPVIADLSVGYNLQDHVGVIVAHQTERYTSSPEFNPYAPAGNYINGFATINKSQTFPDVQYLMESSRNAQNILQLFAFNLNIQDDIAQKAYEANKRREVLLTYIFNLRPLSRGRVMLRSTDPTDQPEIHLGAFSNKTDLDNMVQYVKDFLRIENTKYFRSVNAKRIDLAGDRCKGFRKNSDKYWRCYNLCLMFSIYHYSGTCSMGTVVDDNLRVIGVQGLRVVDASIFPVIPSANTNAPTMMVAEKAADIIKEEHCI